MKIIILILSVFLSFANCSTTNTVYHHGVHKLKIKQEKLITDKTNKNDIVKILGNPSAVSFFDNEVLFFIERKTNTGPFFKLGAREIIVNNVLVVEIDNYGLLSKKKFYDLTKMNDFDFSNNVTQVEYQKNSYVYNFLSSMRQKINDPLGKRRNK